MCFVRRRGESWKDVSGPSREPDRGLSEARAVGSVSNDVRRVSPRDERAAQVDRPRHETKNLRPRFVVRVTRDLRHRELRQRRAELRRRRRGVRHLSHRASRHHRAPVSPPVHVRRVRACTALAAHG